jgi:hypothetical protein
LSAVEVVAEVLIVVVDQTLTTTVAKPNITKPKLKKESSRAAKAAAKLACTEVLAAINSAPADPMQNHRYLHEAAVNGWLLSTPLLRSLVGIRPQGQSFHRMGFKFDRVGREWRVQAWWIQSMQGQ